MTYPLLTDCVAVLLARADAERADPARTIPVRLVSIALRRFTALPSDEDRSAASTTLALNAMRLAVQHVGRKKAAELALQALNEGGAE